MILLRIFIFLVFSWLADAFCINNSSKVKLQKVRIQQGIDSADMIINKYIDALGGKEKLESIHTLYLKGEAIRAGQKIITTTWTVNNKGWRSETVVGGFTNWSIARIDSGWSYAPSRGQKSPQPWPKDRVKIAQCDLDTEGILVDYKSKGYRVEYRGIEQIEGSDVYKIEEKLNDWVTKSFYIDMDSYLIIRVRSKYTTPNRVNYSNTDYSNYQKTSNGYMFPMQAGNVKYTSVKVNEDISDNLFIPKK
jgi:hypothetical protein